MFTLYSFKFLRMKKYYTFLFLILVFLTNVEAQQHKAPKLFVGIVVDQMRPEYLSRFYDQFGDNGFKRLMNDGFNCRNVHYNYIPTYTGPGHASIYAGTTPSFHGIIANDWYNRKLKHTVYCVDDTTERVVGIDGSKKGASPRNLLSTNISDELKISTNQNAKVIGISLKDRAAILPAGHMADGAYWFDLKSGNFVSSTFYMKKLPDWVSNFNNEKKAFNYLENTWKLLLPESSYPLSIADDNQYEGKWIGKQQPVFPYNLKELAPQNPPYFEVLYASPYGNNLLTDFAIETIKHEALGNGKYSDLLAISYSSTDAVGHKFGPLSKEVNDTYLRLDKDIARLLDALDQLVGKDNYTLFLTADHGMAEVSQYLIDNKVPAGYLDDANFLNEASMFLEHQFGEKKLIDALINNQFYLNRTLINEKKLNLVDVQNQLAKFTKDKDGISQVYTASQFDGQVFTQNLSVLVQNGFYYKRSGDVAFALEPGWTDEDKKNAATHGTGYTYDTHVPLLWFGAGISKGESFVRYNITDIAPSVSAILNIKFPSAGTGNPIIEITTKNSLKK